MERFQEVRRLDYSTPRNTARNGRTLEDWVRLARKSPRAVPVSVQRTIARRYSQLAQELGYS